MRFRELGKAYPRTKRSFIRGSRKRDSREKLENNNIRGKPFKAHGGKNSVSCLASAEPRLLPPVMIISFI